MSLISLFIFSIFLKKDGMILTSKFQIITIVLLVCVFQNVNCKTPERTESYDFGEMDKNSGVVFSPDNLFLFHDDSIHRLDFRYADKPRGIKPFIAPALLISAGTALHFKTDAKEGVRDFVQDNFGYSGHLDDYAQYAPIAAVYSLHALGIKGKNNFGNLTAITAKSFLLNGLIVDQLKYRTHVERPNGGSRSFPSGHTSKAFALAHVMHKEYGEISPWYSIGAYSCAAATGVMRVAKNAHWISDILAGAGIGMLSTELVYLTHQYKWDNEHVRNLDIFPFQIGRQKGVTLVYTF
jgi:membrane-associated phospholipid phosphatase